MPLLMPAMAAVGWTLVSLAYIYVLVEAAPVTDRVVRAVGLVWWLWTAWMLGVTVTGLVSGLEGVVEWTGLWTTVQFVAVSPDARAGAGHEWTDVQKGATR